MLFIERLLKEVSVLAIVNPKVNRLCALEQRGVRLAIVLTLCLVPWE